MYINKINIYTIYIYNIYIQYNIYVGVLVHVCVNIHVNETITTVVQIKTVLRYSTTGFACFCFQVKNLYSINTWNRLRHTYVLSLLILGTTFVYLCKDNLQCAYYHVGGNILRRCPFLHSVDTLFRNYPYDHGKDAFLTSFLCFRVSYRNFLCYFRKDFNFSISKTPTMNLEKMLKIIYQKRGCFMSFCSVS